jgi:hypothetical protein
MFAVACHDPLSSQVDELGPAVLPHFLQFECLVTILTDELFSQGYRIGVAAEYNFAEGLLQSLVQIVCRRIGEFLVSDDVVGSIPCTHAMIPVVDEGS